MEMDASTLTRNLQPLIASGWVEVGPGPDGRIALGHGHAGRPGQAGRGAARMEAGAARAQCPARRGRRVVALHALLDECLATINEAEDAVDG